VVLAQATRLATQRGIPGLDKQISGGTLNRDRGATAGGDCRRHCPRHPAAGGPEVAGVFPLALRVRADLIRHRAIPPSANAAARHVFLGQAWMSIHAAMATLHEIRFGPRRRKSLSNSGVAN
jgi:hypothetical protein